jgi:hypothetical protein
MTILMDKSYRALVTLDLPLCYFVQMLSLPSNVSYSEDNIPWAWCHFCLWSGRFLKSHLFLIFRLKLCKSILNSNCNKV